MIKVSFGLKLFSIGSKVTVYFYVFNLIFGDTSNLRNTDGFDNFGGDSRLFVFIWSCFYIEGRDLEILSSFLFDFNFTSF